MNFCYIISIFYLIISFLLLNKSKQKQSIITSIVYSICLLFCYNTFIVCAYSFFKIDGNLLVLSIINLIVGSIFNLISLKTKKIQEYILDKKELIGILGLIIIILFIGILRFRGFTSISYESVDPAIHYKHALYFSEELELLNASNCNDIVHGDFSRVMPISYINAGIILKIFDTFSSYTIFNIYNVLCLVLSSILFFVTILKKFYKKTSNYHFYSFILTLLYTLAFPLNNLVYGFCYLGIGVMVVNLLLLTIDTIKDFNKGIAPNLIILFMLNFSLFFSYYLFVPCIYLALGLYYIYLWKKEKITFSKLIIYGSITLILPFIIGFVHFILPDFLIKDGGNIFTYINLWGAIYDNVTPIYLFLILSIISIYRLIKKKEKLNYFNFNFYIISCYILLFSILYILKFSELYYFYKLFYLYWFFAIILIGTLMIPLKKWLYRVLQLIIIGMCIVCICPYSKITSFLIRTNIFNWNAVTFIDDKIIFTEKELEIMEASRDYQDVCAYNKEFLMVGNLFKNMWFYSATDMIPIFNYQDNEGSKQLYGTNTSFKFWSKNLNDRPCLIYFYEKNDEDINYDENEFDILYSNKAGIILKRKNV